MIKSLNDINKEFQEKLLHNGLSNLNDDKNDDKTVNKYLLELEEDAKNQEQQQEQQEIKVEQQEIQQKEVQQEEVQEQEKKEEPTKNLKIIFKIINVLICLSIFLSIVVGLVYLGDAEKNSTSVFGYKYLCLNKEYNAGTLVIVKNSKDKDIEILDTVAVSRFEEINLYLVKAIIKKDKNVYTVESLSDPTNNIENISNEEISGKLKLSISNIGYFIEKIKNNIFAYMVGIATLDIVLVGAIVALNYIYKKNKKKS